MKIFQLEKQTGEHMFLALHSHGIFLHVNAALHENAEYISYIKNYCIKLKKMD